MKFDIGKFIFRTRGIYLFSALLISIILKSNFGGYTKLSLVITGSIIAGITQVYRTYGASFLLGKQAVLEVQANFFCTSGPYAYVRNPLYLGNLIIGLSICLAINEWYAYILYILSYIFVYSIIIPHEEKFLLKTYGDEYTIYCNQIRRLIPKFKPYKGKNRSIPNIKVGVLAELHGFIIISALFVWIALQFIN